ncbi:hypothetical protein GCM10027343_38860 [Noviherbaspirillum agri]
MYFHRETNIVMKKEVRAYRPLPTSLPEASHMTRLPTSSSGVFLPRSAFRLIAALLFFWTVFGNASADDAVRLPPGTQHYALGPQVSYLEDAAQKITLADVLAGKFDSSFVRNTQPSPNLGFTSSTYWFKTTLRSEDSGTSEWLLEVQYPLLDYIDLHLVYAGPDARTVS